MPRNLYDHTERWFPPSGEKVLEIFGVARKMPPQGLAGRKKVPHAASLLPSQPAAALLPRLLERRQEHKNQHEEREDRASFPPPARKSPWLRRSGSGSGMNLPSYDTE